MTLPWHSPTYNDQFTLFSQLLAPIAPGPGDGARQALGGTGMSCCDDTSRCHAACFTSSLLLVTWWMAAHLPSGLARW